MSSTILLVDDDPVSLTLLTKLVEKLDYEAFQAMSGHEALELMNEHAVDLIIADYEMPAMNGLELLKTVKAEYPSLPFVLVTAYSNLDVIREAWLAEAFDFFQKPVSVDRLRQTIEIGLNFGHLKLARRRFPIPANPAADPTLLDLGVVQDLAAALNAPDLATIVAEYDVHARIDLAQIRRFHLAKQPALVRIYAHRLAGTSLNLGLSKLSEAFRAIEKNPGRPLRHRQLAETLELSIYWLKFHLSEVLHDLAG